jgi:hypothetical protein
MQLSDAKSLKQKNGILLPRFSHTETLLFN